MGLFGKKGGHLGIDIGADGIKLVEIKKVKGRPCLWTYGMLSKHLDIHPPAAGILSQDQGSPSQLYPSPYTQIQQKEQKTITQQAASAKKDPRIKEYGKLLKTIMKQAKVTSRRATASLPVSQVFHAIITLPQVEKKDLPHHVHAKVKKMLPRPIEHMQVVHQLLPQESKKTNSEFLRVLVTAAPKNLVSFYSSIFQEAGVELEELETEAFAIERSLIGHDESTILVIDLGSQRTNFFVMDNSIPITHRSIHIGGEVLDEHIKDILAVDSQKAEQIKIDLSRTSGQNQIDKNIFLPLINPIVKEIHSSIDVFDRQLGQHNKKIQKIILTGGTCLFPPILDTIQEKLNLSVFVGDPWARVVYQQGLKSVLDAIGPRMAVSIGLAMRTIVK